MAQALFDDHPLREYLRDAGESLTPMPGASNELRNEIDELNEAPDDLGKVVVDLDQYCPQFLIELLKEFRTAMLSWQAQAPSRSFVERFKYNVISSSLLSSVLPSSQSGRSPRTMSIPGKHSRTSSMDLDRPIPPLQNSEPSYWLISVAFACVAILFTLGCPFLGTLASIALSIFFYNAISTKESSKHDMTPTLDSLQDVITANEAWESIVQDAINIIETDELQLSHSLSSSSPPSPIRIALISCLQTTQTQSDNVRHLFSALTAPTVLSQLSEMYAPPSPMKPVFTTESSTRPFSYPAPRPKSYIYPPPVTPDKRSTWNGSYASLAYAGSPTSSINRRKDKHHANLSEVFIAGFNSVPTTPFTPRTFTRIPELSEQDIHEENDNDEGYSSPSIDQFGSAILDLQRDRKAGGFEKLAASSPSYLKSDFRSPRNHRLSLLTSPSKYTTVQSSRHPLSLSSLRNALQGAIAAKRYACSHLLALRFNEEDEEGYWEDVRSVMSLLASALTDSSTRLNEALEEADQQKLADQNPTPDTSMTASDSDGDVRPTIPKLDLNVCFAPMPSHYARFAAHIAAISSSLDDARDHIEQCVSALKDQNQPTSMSSNKLQHSRSFSRTLSSIPGAVEAEDEEHPAMQAYERLRRELGLALRECERGRERMLEIIRPPLVSTDEDDEGLGDDVPGLAHDASDDSDKPDPNSPFSEFEEGEPAAVLVEGGGPGNADDITSHLLMMSNAQQLPLPGIEEVFEADTESKAGYARERSKLTREERIRIAKARRDSGLALGPGGGEVEDGTGAAKLKMETWGPGGEVVQELKDVIWKVGEKRRKMTGVAQSEMGPPQTSLSTPSTPPSTTPSPLVLV